VEPINRFQKCSSCKGEMIIQGEKTRLRKSKEGKITKQSRATSALSIKIKIFYNIRTCTFVNRYRLFGEGYWNQFQSTARKSDDSRRRHKVHRRHQ